MDLVSHTQATSSLPRVHALNEHAVNLLQTSQYKEAIASLQEALRCLLHLIAFREVDLSSERLPCREAGIESVQVADASGDLDDQATVVLFARAMVFSFEDAPQGLQTLDTISAVLMYNIGLGYHLGSVSKMQPQKLDRALGMYDAANKVLSLQPVEGHRRYLKLALTNNKCHIFSLRFHVDKVRDCLSSLRSILSDPSPTEASKAHCDYEHFHLNVLISNSDRLCAPAA